MGRSLHARVFSTDTEGHLLANLYAEERKLAEAERLYVQVVETSRRVLGEENATL